MDDDAVSLLLGLGGVVDGADDRHVPITEEERLRNNRCTCIVAGVIV